MTEFRSDRSGPDGVTSAPTPSPSIQRPPRVPIRPHAERIVLTIRSCASISGQTLVSDCAPQRFVRGLVVVALDLAAAQAPGERDRVAVAAHVDPRPDTRP